MALSRRTGQRFQASIWPGFVDAMTGLLMVVMFLLTIFMVLQYALSETIEVQENTISGQENQLDALASEVSALALALGLEERENSQLQARMGALNTTLNSTQSDLEQARAEMTSQASLIASLSLERDQQNAALATAETRITSFEAQVAALLADRDRALGDIVSLESQRADLLTEQEALNLALAQTRTEIDDQVEAARLAAARREALEALISDLRQRNAENATEAAQLADQIVSLEQQLSEEEIAKLTEAAAAQALRDKLAGADAELTAMTLALEAQRQEAEDTLTLLAAADVAREELDRKLAETLAQFDNAQAEASEREELAVRLNRALAQMEIAQSKSGQTMTTLEAELTRVKTDLAIARAAVEATNQDRASVEARLLQALESLERAQASATDQDVLRARLAAALAARQAAEISAEDQLSLAEQRAVLLAKARETLSEQEEISAEAQRQTALLNQQVAALRTQLGGLQALLDDFKERDVAANVQLQNLGSDLNAALARAASEERKRRLLEEAERKRLEIVAAERAAEAETLKAQAKDLERYRSEFFGRLRDVLGTQEGVRIEGDRFVFSSEVLFPPGGADLSFEGQIEIAKVANILRSVADEIPPEIDWVIRVDGHTDNTPLIGHHKYVDNWELSQGRALSVVRYMSEFLGIPPDRLSANGFGEFQPVNLDDTPEAHAQNRRIELKLTEK
jgi:chemotaxis protein MotB